MSDSVSGELSISPQITRDYQIVRLLGRGGMGEVYLAEQLRVGRRLVALKVLNQEFSRNPNVMRRFENEAASAGMIQHRNVVTIYESRMTTDGQIYVAMEYVHGESLRDLLTRMGALPLTTVVEITRQACAGLGAAHRLGIVHRDIKPDNIMLTEEDGKPLVKLLDFGIARLAESGSEGQQTKAGAVIGTPEYMSPEQAAGWTGDRIDLRSDIYSLGMVIYEMLTGQVAFPSSSEESYLSVLHRQMRELPIPPAQKLPGASGHPLIDAVVMKALAKEREQRQASAQQLSQELMDAFQQVNVISTGKNIRVATVAEAINSTLSESTQKTAPTRMQKTEPVAEQPVTDSPGQSPGTRQSVVQPVPVPPAWWKRTPALLALASMLLLTVLGVSQIDRISRWITPEVGVENKGRKEEPQPSSNAVLKYRVRLRESSFQLDTLPENNQVYSGDRFLFEFELTRPAAIYFFEPKPDGSMDWYDAAPDGKAAINEAGRKIQIPRQQWIGVGFGTNEIPGEEKFLLVCVPATMNWSLAELIAPEPLNVSTDSLKQGTATLSQAAASRLRAFLNEPAVIKLEAVARREGNIVTHTVSQTVEAERISFYEINLPRALRK